MGVWWGKLSGDCKGDGGTEHDVKFLTIFLSFNLIKYDVESA